MKKIISIILVICFAATMLVACGSKETDYTLGIGMAVSSDISAFEASTTVASVVLDADGKVVICRIDAIDVAAKVDGTAESATYKTKTELGDDYGMVKYNASTMEWYTQAQNFEKAVVGKTADEIAKIKKGDAEIAAGCTIDVTDFVKAVTAACNSEHKVAFKCGGDMQVGLGLTSGADVGEAIEYTSNTAAVVVADGKIVASVIDSLDATMDIDGDTGANFASDGSKLTLGDAYGMLSEYGSSLAEWYTQAQNFANTAVGKATSEVASLATEGVAGCTINVKGYHAALVKAAQSVR